jgi:hypothetical protein
MRLGRVMVCFVIRGTIMEFAKVIYFFDYSFGWLIKCRVSLPKKW